MIAISIERHAELELSVIFLEIKVVNTKETLITISNDGVIQNGTNFKTPEYKSKQITQAMRTTERLFSLRKSLFILAILPLFFYHKIY